jgi:hypothetical protein
LGDGLPALPTRLQLMSFTFDGVWELRFEAAHEQIVTDVALVDAGGGDVWLGWTVGGQVFVARIEPAGSIVLGPIFISDTSVGPIALAMRGEELLVGHIDASDPDLASDVQVTAVSAEGDTRSFGGFDTADAPWNGEISLLVSADETKVIVAYRGSAFDSLPQPFARRFDCVQ